MQQKLMTYNRIRSFGFLMGIVLYICMNTVSRDVAHHFECIWTHLCPTTAGHFLTIICTDMERNLPYPKAILAKMEITSRNPIMETMSFISQLPKLQIDRKHSSITVQQETSLLGYSESH